MQVLPINNLRNYGKVARRETNNNHNFVSLPIQDTVSFKSYNVVRYMDDIAKVPARIWHEGRLVKNRDVNKYIEKLDNFTKEEKRFFVKEFCRRTGFPSLDKVSDRIDKEIMNSVEKITQKAGVIPFFVGYSSISSLGRRLALPGSDADGLYVLTDRPQNMYFNRAVLGFDMNQRIIESTGEHFPEVVSLIEVLQGIEITEKIFNEKIDKSKLKTYQENIQYGGKSFIKAAEFNIDLAEHVEPEMKLLVNLSCFFVELLRSGKVLLNNIDARTLAKIKSSAIYKYSNMYRQEGLEGRLKPKLENRIDICERFENLSDDVQFEICKSILEQSLGVKEDSTPLFEKFNFGDIVEMYKKVGML